MCRDSTVQSLTLQPSIQDGVVVWEDSALLKAAKHGRVLVVDEADKAPLEVCGSPCSRLSLTSSLPLSSFSILFLFC